MYGTPPQAYGTPVPLPASPARDAREMAKWGSLLFVVAALIWVLMGVWNLYQYIYWQSLVGNALAIARAYGYAGYDPTAGFIAGAIFYFIWAGLAIFSWMFTKKNVLAYLDRGEIEYAVGKCLVAAILGFIFGMVIGGILLVLAYMKLGEARVATFAPPPVPPAFQQQQPAPQPGPVVAPPMVAAPVQPAAVVAVPVSPAAPAAGPSACPTCRSPLTLDQYVQRWYCSSCRRHI